LRATAIAFLTPASCGRSELRSLCSTGHRLGTAILACSKTVQA
jgi:hypothetical protein